MTLPPNGAPTDGAYPRETVLRRATEGVGQAAVARLRMEIAIPHEEVHAIASGQVGTSANGLAMA